MTKRALITGITGQDGSYLAELLLKKGYSVTGTIRRISLEHQDVYLSRIKHLTDHINLKFMSLENYGSVFSVIEETRPDELYHLAAQSNVKVSFQDEFTTLNTNINGTQNILSSLKKLKLETKFYFAGSSEMFGKTVESPQNENTKFHPRSAYGISKVTGFELTRNYREAYNFFASTGILFNHESPRRGFEFVTRKISSSVAKIKLGKQKTLQLGNIFAKRDWGHAKDYVEAMWLMLQQKKPSDFVIGTGKMHSVKDFAKLAFSLVGLNYKKYIKFNKTLLRPAEVDTLRANYNKAKKILKWKPKTSLDQMVKEMVLHDIEKVKKLNS